MTNKDNEIFLVEDFAKYSSIEEYRVKLEELRTTNLNELSIEKIQKIIEKYFAIIPSMIAKFSVENFNTFQFYRVRLNIDDKNESLNLIRTYSYPLPMFCKKNGRANIKNKSVFYCTNSPITAILESKPIIGDIGYLSIWEGHANRTMKAGILLAENLKEPNMWQQLAKDIHQNATNHYSDIHKSEYYLETIRFISRLFLEEKDPYPITSYISNGLIYGESWKDFIVYPSFVTDSASCNMAFHPNSIDNFLKFKKVIRFKLIDIQGEKHTYSTGRVGEVVNTDIEWRYARDEELDFELFPQ